MSREALFPNNLLINSLNPIIYFIFYLQIIAVKYVQQRTKIIKNVQNAANEDIYLRIPVNGAAILALGALIRMKCAKVGATAATFTGE